MNNQTIINLLKKNKRFIISAHVNPDPDALCSELAFYFVLKALKKEVTIVNEGVLPSRFSFFPGSQFVRSDKDIQSIDYDVIVVLDCGDLDRIGTVQKLLSKDKKIVNIDHHVTNDLFGDYNLVKPKASSTAEVLYELFEEAGFKITDDIAMLLYAGILTDTGSFRYENTHPNTHIIASRLKKFNFSSTDLYKKIYETIPINDMLYFIKVVNRMESFVDNKILSVALPKSIVSKFSMDFDLRDTIFRFLREVKGVEVLVIFTENKKNITRVNLRSTGTFDVARFAKNYGGGGHKRASGCVLNMTIKDAKKKIIKGIQKEL